MKISDIYKKYNIPPNLQDHMYRVAAVGAYISDNWKGPTPLDRDSIIQALLFHDMGNIIKFDFRYSHLMGEEAKNLDYWKKVQQEFKEKYENDEHIATFEIAKEVGINEKAFKLLYTVGSSKLQQAIDTNDMDHKVTCYSDFRVDPLGVVTVNKRFDDIVKRYQGRSHSLGDTKRTEKLRVYCLELEMQLQNMVVFNFNELSNKDINKIVEDLHQYKINV